MDKILYIKRFAIKLIPQNYKIYNFFKRYIDMYNGDNNDNMLVNGEIHFLKCNLRDKDIVFDVGAKIGEWTNFALKFNKNIYIHCFEPSNFAFKQLVKNNFPINIVCNNLGLSSKKEERFLYSIKKGAGLNSLYQRKSFIERIGKNSELYKEEISLDTLENYCKQKNIKHIDFLKVDVEGHEYEVLEGGKKMFEKSQVNIIQFEYGGTYIDAHIFLKDIFDLFEDLNYNFYKIYPKNVRFIKSYNPKYENFQYQNWLIIRKDYKFNS